MAWHAERPLPYHLAYLAEACRVAAVAARVRRGPSARAFRHELGRGRHARARARRAGVQLHGARAGGVRRAALPRHRRKSAPLGVRGGDQRVRPQPALPLGRARALAQGQRRALRAGGELPRGRAGAAAGGAARGLRRPAVRAEGPAAAGRGGGAPRGEGHRARDRARRRRRTAGRARSSHTNASALGNACASPGGYRARRCARRSSRRARWSCRAWPKACRSC